MGAYEKAVGTYRKSLELKDAVIARVNNEKRVLMEEIASLKLQLEREKEASQRLRVKTKASQNQARLATNNTRQWKKIAQMWEGG